MGGMITRSITPVNYTITLVHVGAPPYFCVPYDAKIRRCSHCCHKPWWSGCSSGGRQGSDGEGVTRRCGPSVSITPAAISRPPQTKTCARSAIGVRNENHSVAHDVLPTVVVQLRPWTPFPFVVR